MLIPHLQCSPSRYVQSTSILLVLQRSGVYHIDLGEKIKLTPRVVYISTDHGATWERLEEFANQVTLEYPKYGITTIQSISILPTHSLYDIIFPLRCIQCNWSQDENRYKYSSLWFSLKHFLSIASLQTIHTKPKQAPTVL